MLGLKKKDCTRARQGISLILQPKQGVKARGQADLKVLEVQHFEGFFRVDIHKCVGVGQSFYEAQ